MRRFGPLLLIAAALLAGGALCPGCGPKPADERVTARVGGRPLYEREVRARFSRRLEELPAGQPQASKEALWASVVDDLLQEAAVRMAAREQHVAVLEDEVDGWLAHRGQHGTPSPALRQSAQAYLLRGKLVATRVAARVTVDEAALDAFASAHAELLSEPARVRLRFVRLPVAASAKALQKAVRRGRGPLEAAHETFGGSVETGDFGLVALASLPAEVQRRVERLPLHRLSEPLALGEQHQWVFWLSERHGASRSPPAVARRRLERALRREREARAEEAVVNELRAAAQAEILHGTMPNDV